MQKMELSWIFVGNLKDYNKFLEGFKFLINLNMHLSCDPVISLRSDHEKSTHLSTNIVEWKCLYQTFYNSPKHKYPSVVKEWWRMYVLEYNVAIKITMQINFKIPVLSERYQNDSTYCLILLT